MRIVTRCTLQEFWTAHPRSEQALKAWYAEAKAADWRSPEDVKREYGSASIVDRNRVVFDICGNRYRLVVHVAYRIGFVHVRFIGARKEHDGMDAEVIR